MAAAWQTITAWACLLLASVAVHIALGEVVLTVLLIVFVTVAFTGRKGPQQINGRDAEDIDIEVQHPDEDEPTTANPLNAAQNDASEGTPKLRPLRSPSAELRRSAPAEAAPVAAAARLPFLDTVKVFLTALVVLHHCACAFGACGEGSWYLIVKGGGGPRAFRLCVKTFVTWNQCRCSSLSASVWRSNSRPHAIDADVVFRNCAFEFPRHRRDVFHTGHAYLFRRATRKEAGRRSKRTKGGAYWPRPSPSSWSCRR